MKNFVRIDENGNSYFINRANIAGINIGKDAPTFLRILMIGDTDPYDFSFDTVKDRNDKLTEILGKGEEINDNLCSD